MLTRQWQVGEFQGEDAGTPVVARVRAQSAMLSRCHLGALPATASMQAAPYDSNALPLEVLVERQRVRSVVPADMKQLRLIVDAGLHFLRMLEQLTLTGSYRDAFIARYPLPLPNAQQVDATDAETRRFVLMMAGRVVDARLLEAAFQTEGDTMPVFDPMLGIAAADRVAVGQVALQWLTWYLSLFSESEQQTAGAWIAERMEYAVSVAGRLSAAPGAEKTLTAAEVYAGHVDWSDFDVHPTASLGAQSDNAFTSIVQTTVPAPVSFRGAPAARFWEFEDARVEYGLLPAGPTDLAQLMMVEYASSYGNDWFVIPLELPVGSLTSVKSLVVTDTFGVRTLQRPLGDGSLPQPNWSMFQHSHLRTAGSAVNGIERNLLLLAPALGRSLQSSPIEDVLFMRDEMANVAWAIERVIESPLSQPLERADAVLSEAAAPAAPADSGALPRYLLSSQVPAHWIPLLPVQLPGPAGTTLSRLERGAVLQPDGSRQVRHALGTLLSPGGRLLLHDEEVPREGVRVTRHYQMARWTDGSTFTWIANRKQVGRGEGSSGLRFDTTDLPGEVANDTGVH